MLYYGRYVRNEAFVALFGVISIWAILRYLETGKNRYLYWLTAVMVLHFATKETSFIYAAQALLFLGLYFVYRITQKQWRQTNQRTYFLLSLILALVLLTVGVLIRSLAHANIPDRGGAIPPDSFTPHIHPDNCDCPGGYLTDRSRNLPFIRVLHGSRSSGAIL